jgi:hypothetical protein
MYISIQKFVYIIILFVLILQYSNSYKLVNRVRNKIVSKNDVTAINNDAVNNMMKKGLTTMIISLSLLSLPLISLPSTSFAADSKGGLIYKTGKSPKQEDPNDPKKGTKKESSFLRCLSNCKADCQKPGGIYVSYKSINDYS